MCRTQGKRLLAQQVFAPPGAGEHGGMVHGIGQREVHRIDVGVVHQRVHAVVDFAAAEFIRKGPVLFGGAAHAGCQAGMGACRNGRGNEVSRDPARPGNAPADGGGQGDMWAPWCVFMGMGAALA